MAQPTFLVPTVLVLVSSALACSGPLPPENPKTQLDERAEVAPVLTEPEPAAPAVEEPPPPTPPPWVAFKDVGLETPESVFYESESDVYFVSNISGAPDVKDGNGFISVLDPEGTVKELKWIAGGQNGVTLNAPKGMAVRNGELWVSDVDHVRSFNLKTGKPGAAIAVGGATFLNDVTLGPDGKIYVSDTGVKLGKDGFEPTGSDAIYRIDGNKAVALIKTQDLAKPNGLVFQGERLLMVNFGGKALRAFDKKGKQTQAAELPSGLLDGIVVLDEDDFLISSWEKNLVYRGGFAREFNVVVTDVKSPADIGYDTKRQRVLIPLFLENEVRAVPLDSAVAAVAVSPPPAASPSAASSP